MKPRRQKRGTEKRSSPASSSAKPPQSRNLVWCPKAFKAKLQYTSEAAANRALKFAEHDDFGHGVPTRSYHCSACGCWHTTSQETSHLRPLPEDEHRHTKACWVSPKSPCWKSTASLVTYYLSCGYTLATIGERLEASPEVVEKLLTLSEEATLKARGRHWHTSACWEAGSPCWKASEEVVYRLVAMQHYSFERIALQWGTAPGIIKSIYNNAAQRRDGVRHLKS